jgi:hypothetical protein
MSTGDTGEAKGEVETLKVGATDPCLPQLVMTRSTHTMPPMT